MIRARSEIPQIRILDGWEYRQCLGNKLDEEVSEFHIDNNLEELADILEAVYAPAEAAGHMKAQLDETYAVKHEIRGAFRNRIFLISKEG